MPCSSPVTIAVLTVLVLVVITVLQVLLSRGGSLLDDDSIDEREIHDL